MSEGKSGTAGFRGLRPTDHELSRLDREPTPAERKAFLKAATALAGLGRSGLHVYLANDSLNLLTGPSHEGGGTARQDRVRESIVIPNAGGGDW